MIKVVILTGKAGDLCNRLFRFARFYCTKPKGVYLVDLTLYQFAYLFSPKSRAAYILFLLLRLLNNKRWKIFVKFLERCPCVEKLTPPGSDVEGASGDLGKFYRDVVASHRLVILVEESSFFERSVEGSEDARARLRNIFSLKARYKRAALKLLGGLNQTGQLIGVHLRRRDYRTFAGGEFFFEDEEYNRQMLEVAASARPECQPVFILICEEPLDVDNFRSSNVRCFGPSSVGVDQALLETCDGIMGPHSTFNAWPSFLYGIPRAVITRRGTDLRHDDFSPTSVNYLPG